MASDPQSGGEVEGNRGLGESRSSMCLRFQNPEFALYLESQT